MILGQGLETGWFESREDYNDGMGADKPAFGLIAGKCPSAFRDVLSRMGQASSPPAKREFFGVLALPRQRQRQPVVPRLRSSDQPDPNPRQQPFVAVGPGIVLLKLDLFDAPALASQGNRAMRGLTGEGLPCQ